MSQLHAIPSPFRRAGFVAKTTPDEQLHLEINGVIGEGWAEDSVSVKAFRAALEKHQGVKTIRLSINSPGGSFFDGLTMYQLLQESPARVIVDVGAVAASAATLPMMAGDEITMRESSVMLVHPVWTVVLGNASELRKAAADLDTLSDSAVRVYAARTGMREAVVSALMTEDRFMGAEEAHKLGFCNAVIKSKGKVSSRALTELEVRDSLASVRSAAESRLTQTRMAGLNASSAGGLAKTWEDMSAAELRDLYFNNRKRYDELLATKDKPPPPPTGKKWEEMSATELRSLYFADRRAFEACSADFKKRQGDR